ncbi:ABC-2 type transport system permease protein [Desulfonispora thiosulfatigenes DSM 11270]|uniref:ABC-2 type transport system permease protein n=1 Tax=Desulfonispora thiosulfatigenes DSM 11270 TaxID=656914 RepID=A0A1W1UWA3_DESTI|nr:hypothetical protein [Desulfonispora thiosulfatigenes]SMB85071.1 ABC-2 type transport system permease protein [Desulfonispora thiosulfatigenes DSM 11270]
MKYKTSYFNMPMILEDFKRLWGLSALYFISLFFTGPLPIMLRMGDKDRSITYIVESFLKPRGFEIQGFYSIVFAILLSLLIYRYLHTINSTTVIHSFPITRKQLFHSHSVAGFILIIIPVLINMLFLLGLMVASNDGSIFYQEVFTTNAIMAWTGKTLLGNIIVYLISSLVAMVTGTSIVQGVLSLIFIFLPIGLGSLILVNLDQLVYGFAGIHSDVESFLLKIIPVTGIWTIEKIDISQILWYLILGLILYIIALQFYKIRSLERATDPITLEGLKPIFKYGVTFCSMVLGGAYFYSVIRVDAWLYLGYAIGGFLGYLIAEMLLKKTIWVFKNIKGFVIYSLIIMIVFVGIKLDFTGYEKRIPEVGRVQNAYYGNGSSHQYRYGEQEGLKKLENIELIRELHQEMIENKKEFMNMAKKRAYNTVSIAYELENGKKIYRDYEAPDEFVQKNPTIKKIFETMEYKRKYHNIFKVDTEAIDYIEINPDYIYQVNKSIKIINKDEIKELTQALKMDLLDESYEEHYSNIIPWASINVRTKASVEMETNDEKESKYSHIDVTWKKSYSMTAKWLKDKGYYEKVRVMPEDINSIVVGKVEKEMDRVYSAFELEKLAKDQTVKIKDKEKIEYLLTNQEGESYLGNSYYMGVYLNNGNKILGYISEEKVPREIKDALK